jgi:cell volume regulation protein A
VAWLLARLRQVPDVAIFLVMGVLLGPDVAGVVAIKPDSTFTQLALTFGACYILSDGGSSLRLHVVSRTWITIVVLATVGVVITAAITGFAAHHILHTPLVFAMLLACVIASTDPATLIPVFRQVKVRDRVAQTVIAESALNDATGAILTFTVLGIATGTREFSAGSMLLDLLKQAGIGLAIGVLLGYIVSFLVAHEKHGLRTEYAVAVSLMAVIGAYLGAEGLQASGFMAVFVFGFTVGNMEEFGLRMGEAKREKLGRVAAVTTLIARVLIFVLLGAQLDFGLVDRFLAGGIAVVAVFMLVARPVTVFACALPDRRAKWTAKEMLFMCWTRETGVIPGALAGLLLGMGAPDAKLIASVTFLAILVTILVQATTTRWLARRLGLLEESFPDADVRGRGRSSPGK